MATNKNAVKYATTGTPKKFWTVWKEQDTAFLGQALERYLSGKRPPSRIAAWSLSSIPAEYWS